MSIEIGTKFTTKRSALQQAFVSGSFYGKLVKRRKDGFCQKCKGEIKKGDEVLAVEQRDGFLAKYIGLCHVECFENFR